MTIEFGIGPGEKAYFQVDAVAFCAHEGSSIQTAGIGSVSGDLVVSGVSVIGNVVTFLADATTAKKDTVCVLTLNMANTQVFVRQIRFELGSE
jgi:hypothetical protein